MKKCIALFFALMFISISLNVHAQGVNKEKMEFNIPGKLLKAYAVALDEFMKKGADLDKFTIEILDRDDKVDVAFVPVAYPEESGIRGGRTKAGEEVHYSVSYPQLKILKIWYGR